VTASPSGKFLIALSFAFYCAVPISAQAIEYGIDVSDDQGSINWSQVAAAGKTFVFIKATSGLKGNQSYFVQNIQSAAAAGLKAAAYHFAYPNYTTANTGTAEAQHFLTLAKPYITAGFLRPGLDIEDDPGLNSKPGLQLGKTALSQWIRDFASEVKLQTGVDIMIYSTRYYARNYFDPDLAGYPYWVPTNDGDPSGTPFDMGIWTNWSFKQYLFGTDANGNITATCPGVSGGCDLDSFNGDLNALANFVIPYNANNSVIITSVLPTSIGIAAGGTFTITSTINAADSRTVLLGASLFPAGQTSGRIDDPPNDQSVSLSAGQNTPQRQFFVPLNTPVGTYDLVIGLWNDVNNNGVIDAGDQEITNLKINNAVSVLSGSSCSYTLSPTELDLTTSGGAASGFGVFTSSSCSWTAIPNQNWISITNNGSGSGSLEVYFTVAANTGSTSRTGTIAVQDKIFIITQPGATSQNVTVSNLVTDHPISHPGLTPTFYAYINSPVSQNVLLGASIVLSGTSNLYNDPSHDKAATLFAGTTQYDRSFTIPTDVPTGTYDMIFGVWADTNGNGHIDPTTDTLLGSFTAYGALTVQPAIGSVQGFIVPNDAVAAGGNWRIDGGNWAYTGSTLGGFAVGNHTVNFKLAPGWTKPPDQIVPVQANQTTQVTGTYAPIALGNISTRLSVGTGDNVMIGGFIINGTQPKKVIVRAIGPSLTQFGLSDVLADPTLELHDGSGALIATNDNWQTTQIGGIITADQVNDIQNSGLAPTQAAESAIIATLQPGNYTAIVRGTNNTTGIALVEGYDLDRTVDAKLANISTRGLVQTGDNVMIGGIIVIGNNPQKVIIRAIGPSLSNYGITNPLADPTLELYDGNGVIATNDNWQTTQIGGIITSDQSTEIQNSGLEPSQAAESAIIATLNPGSYTAIVRGNSNTSGVALVEVYQLGN
jgi:GH25 family lysozyme M1 (1,4-beta-N-acetylmuramidase)